MKTYSTLLFLAVSTASAAVLEPRDACNADNCLRALRATSRLSFASSDCSNFLNSVTATPTSFTTLPASTVTVTTYSIYSNPPAKREQPAGALNPRDPVAIIPRSASTTSIPTYASACSGSVRYSSACSCIGVTAGPITASTTVTQTITPPTVTQTSTISVCNPSNDYGLAWASGEWGQPSGNKPGYSSFSATAAECCAACYTTKGCAFFEFFEEVCYLTTFGGGPVTNPYNS
ncbi:hypothetical protein EG329_004138, partial [Mollisiaceae sp. DMI_Dod_QoI]